MHQTSRKRGRPRKYASQEEKAKRDVVAKRIRRQLLRSTEVGGGIRFKAYNPHPAEAIQNAFAQQDGSQVTGCLRDPTATAELAQRVDMSSRCTLSQFTSDSNLVADELYSPSAQFGNSTARAASSSHDLPTQTKQPWDTSRAYKLIYPCPRSPQSVSTREVPVSRSPSESHRFLSSGETSESLPYSSNPVLCSTTQSDNDVRPFSQPLDDWVDIDAEAGSMVDSIRPDQQDGAENPRNEQGSADEPASDYEILSDEDNGSNSDSESDSSGARNDTAIDSSHDDTIESNHVLAKRFLEKTWARLCNCQEEDSKSFCEGSTCNLRDMVNYWQRLGVPDSIGTIIEKEHDVGNARLDWSSILSGGNNRPTLDVERSQINIPAIERTWDVDSIITWASCLSINRGLYVSYHPPASRNFGSSLHVSHSGIPLHLIPHFRLGSGRQSPQFSVYVFCPRITHVCRTTTYLTQEERRMWIDSLLLPAIRHTCPPDIIQHHPRSFDDVESKAYSRQRETCGGMVQNTMDMHHYLPQEYLPAIWSRMTQIIKDRDLAKFQGMFIVLCAKNIKLEAKSLTFQQCRAKILTHLRQVLDWTKADLSNTWMDIGLEDTAISDNYTFLFRSRCLKEWINSMRYHLQRPLLSSEQFNWTLTRQSGSARVETRQSHPLRKGGIAYAQRYNVNKDLFSTASKRDYGLFGEPHLEGLTCPPSLLDAWIVAARQYRSAGLATSKKATPQLKRLRQAFQAMKARIRCALDGSTETSFGVREEYRISWKLFTDVEPTVANPLGSHRPFWVLPSIDVNEFMRWEFNRWLSAIDFIRVRASYRDAGWEDHQRNMILVTILLRSLKASVNCHHIARRSQMFKDTYKNQRGQTLRGLNFEGSMRQTGLAWLPLDLFNWQDFHLHDELVTSTSFTFNGLQGIFSNWKGVEMVSREYNKATELKGCLRSGEADDRDIVLNSMRKMVYRHLSLQVIRQSCVHPDLPTSVTDLHKETWDGYHGLSHDVLYDVTGKEPYLAHVRNGIRGLGHSYHDRVQGLFDWDDGIPRTLWDHCYYRQLARRFYTSIATHINQNDADKWKNSLGKYALPYLWIIPNYTRHDLFARLPRTDNRSNITRPFLSGLYQWKVHDKDGRVTCDETRWLHGGDIYQNGRPTHLALQTEDELGSTGGELPLPSYTINFGCSLPFTKIPGLIEDGFELSRKLLAQGKQARQAHAHFEAARECLIQALGDPLCDVLLMIVITLASSNVTPELPMHWDRLEAGPRKDPSLFAVALTTRMLWFLCPRWFPWEEDDGMVLRIPDMMKKMGLYTHPGVFSILLLTCVAEHRGVNNRLLCHLGWVYRCSGYRENPHNSEIALRPKKKLLELRQELISLMSNPRAFIARIFGSSDDVWVERCFSLLEPSTECSVEDETVPV